MPEMAPGIPAQALINQIDEYIADKTHRYAIALVGDWGSGKTRFLEQRVAPHLKENDIELVRASMFGISSADDLYGRIAMALIHLNGSAKGEAIAEIGKTAVTGIAKKVAESVGLSLNVAASMQAIVSLALGSNRLLVLDDVERRSENSDDLALFGAVNDLIEAMGAKVLLVSSSLSNDRNDSMREFDKNIREKLVWNIYQFKPSPTELAKDILIPNLPSVEDVDVSAAIAAGAEAGKCANARAMIRAEKLVRKLCHLSALSDKEIASQNRFCALRDAVHFALLTCMGRKPQQKEAPEYEGHVTAEMLAHFAEEELYEKYSDFPEIGLYLDPSYEGASANLEEGFRSYIDKRYPHNKSTLEIQKIHEKLQYLNLLEDEDVKPLAIQFQHELLEASFSSRSLRDVISIYSVLKTLGFIPSMTEKDLTDACERVVDNDPSGALQNLIDLDFFFGSSEDPKTIVANQLKKRAEAIQTQKIADTYAVSTDLSGAELAAQLEEMLRTEGRKTIPRVDPVIVAEVFTRSPAQDQEALRSFFLHLRSYLIPNGKDAGHFDEWLRKILEEIDKTEITSKTGSMRKKWMVNTLEKLLIHLKPE